MAPLEWTPGILLSSKPLVINCLIKLYLEYDLIVFGDGPNPEYLEFYSKSQISDLNLKSG